jgi:hypothetical protein
MKLMDEAVFRQGQLTVTNTRKTYLKAGGPGSGRHAQGATEKAWDAGRAANLSGTSTDHHTAAFAHANAAAVNIKEGNPKRAAEHLASAQSHLGLATSKLEPGQFLGKL